MTERKERMTEKKVRKKVDDLGQASYLFMHGVKPCGRRGKSIYFDIPIDETNMFDQYLVDYTSSPFVTFDMCLLNLKKMPIDYLPPE